MDKKNCSTTGATQLTPDNYYTHETDKEYMSVSMFKDFMKCEAAALAKLNDEWQPEQDSTALLVGNYIHSYFESEESHEQFVEANKSAMFSTRGKTKGSLKAPYKIADEMIHSLENETLFKSFYEPGEKEVIVTGEIGGYLWKGKIDSLSTVQGYFCDLKTTRDIHQKIWNEDTRKKENFIQAYGYYYQMAVYIELIKQTFGVNCQPFIFAISKQEPPDKVMIDFNSKKSLSELQSAMDSILELQPHIQNVINGTEPAERCEHCEYCRATKHLMRMTHSEDI